MENRVGKIDPLDGGLPFDTEGHNMSILCVCIVSVCYTICNLRVSVKFARPVTIPCNVAWGIALLFYYHYAVHSRRTPSHCSCWSASHAKVFNNGARGLVVPADKELPGTANMFRWTYGQRVRSRYKIFAT